MWIVNIARDEGSVRESEDDGSDDILGQHVNVQVS